MKIILLLCCFAILLFGCKTTSIVLIDSICPDFKFIDSANFASIEEEYGLFQLKEPPKYLQGLCPSFPLAISVIGFPQKWPTDKREELLSVEKGMAKAVRGLLIQKNDGVYEHILTKPDLEATYSPIESKMEAIAYVSLYTNTKPMYDVFIHPTFKVFVDEISDSYAVAKEGGFEVLTYYYQRFGCYHPYYQVKSFVAFNGDVTPLSRVRAFQDPSMDRMCMD